MKVKKRRKSVRYPGTKTHGRGRKNRTRGLGNRGGVGMSGTGKRGGAKKTLVIHHFGHDDFGKDKALRRGRVVKTEGISLRTIGESIAGWVKKGKAKEVAGGYEIDLKQHKIIGDETSMKLTIHARSASENAKAAVEKAGGKIILVHSDASN